MAAGQSERVRQMSRALWQIMSGAVIATVGLLGWLAAKQRADQTAIHTHLESISTNPIALTFDPRSAHYLPQDNILVWLAALVVAVGLVAVAIGIALALKMRVVTRDHRHDDGVARGRAS